MRETNEVVALKFSELEVSVQVISFKILLLTLKTMEFSPHFSLRTQKSVAKP